MKHVVHKLLILLSMMLAGCTTVGPNFVAPLAPGNVGYEATTLSADASIKAQKLNLMQEISAKWWVVFQNDALNTAIEQAIKNSPTITSAAAKLRQAQEEIIEAISGFFPQAYLLPYGDRQKTPPQSGSPTTNLFNLYNASVIVGYTIDLFGGVRRNVEGQEAMAEYQLFQLETAHITLATNIATLAFKEAALRAKIAATKKIIEDEEKQIEIISKQLTNGSAARVDLLAQSLQLEQTRANLPPFEMSLEQSRRQMAVYMGKLPNDKDMPEFTMDSFSLPSELPLSVPSQIVQQRPDIRAAESQLHYASAKIGVASSNLLPKISLFGRYGLQQEILSNALTLGSTFWTLGAGLLQPVFTGGKLLAKEREAKAAYEEALANYKQVVLQAFQNITDVLAALQYDANLLQVNIAAADQAQNVLEIVKKQFLLGGASYLELLNAENAYQKTSISLADSQAARLADTVALFQALGGGWWNSDVDTNNAYPAMECKLKNIMKKSTD